MPEIEMAKNRRAITRITTGSRFGRWTVMGTAPRVGNRLAFIVKCDCDADGSRTRVVRRDSLVAGGTTSCGCLRAELVAERMTVHGGSYTKLYKIYGMMMERCYNQRHVSYADYGGRGISVCDEWRESFAIFRSDMGEPPTAAHTLDRRDNKREYSRENCRWATWLEQALNRRNSIVVRLDGSDCSLAAAEKALGHAPGYVRRRALRRGVSYQREIDDLLAGGVPPKRKHRSSSYA